MLAIAVAAFTFTACSDVPAPYDLPSINNGPDPTTGILSANFKKGQGDWKTQDVNLPSQLTAIWSYNSKYGMVATAYSDNVNYASESWLIAPAADLSSVEKAVLTIKHAANYFSTSVPVNKACGVMVSTDYSEGATPATATWDELTLSQWPTSFTYIEATADMSKYAGKPKVYVALKYTSTSSKAGTWEVEALSIAEGEATTPQEDTNNYGTAEAPLTVAQALAIMDSYTDGQNSPVDAYVKGFITSFDEKDAPGNSFGNATYFIADQAGGTPTLEVYRGYGLGGEKIKANDLKVGDEVIVTGKLTLFKNTKEFTQGSKIYSLNGNTSGSTTPETPTGKPLEAGKYFFVTTVTGTAQVGTPVASDKDYGYMLLADAKVTNGKLDNDEANLFTFAAVEGGFTIQDTSGRYYYMDGSHKSFQVSASVPSSNHIWTATVADDGTATVKNNGTGLIIQYVAKYKEFTPTDNGDGMPTLMKVGDEVKTDGGGGGGNEPGGGGETATSLVNGDFETWANGLPTGWQSASTASSATLKQSTDAHGGSYAVLVKGDEGSNKRLASQEITLAAGSYNFSFWVKPTTTDVSQVRPAYVVVVDNKVNGSYQYGDYATLSSGWQQISYDFTLSAETTVCLVVMNPKKSSYSSGKDVIIDDATLTKK